jgi:hypothetical protein
VAGLLDRDGVIALGILLSSRLSRLGVYTVSEMLENRYGATSRLISTIIAVTSTIAIGTVFNVVLSLSLSLVQRGDTGGRRPRRCLLGGRRHVVDKPQASAPLPQDTARFRPLLDAVGHDATPPAGLS